MGETNIFKVLADSQRRDILIMLRNERLNAGEIAEKWSQPFSKITLLKNYRLHRLLFLII